MKRLIFAAFLLVCVGLTGCSKSGSSSPQAVFDRASAAAAKSDWKTVYECMDPDKSDQLLFGMTFMSALASMADKKSESEFHDICTRHGVVEMKGKAALPLNDHAKMEQAAHEMFAKVSDKTAYYADLMAFLANRPGIQIGKEFSGTLKDVKETGDTATATLAKLDGKTQTLKFVKRSKGWYFDPTMK
jgi:hypothetical protein